VQILVSFTRDSGCKLLELNLCDWGKELMFGPDLKKLVVVLEKQRYEPKLKQGMVLGE